MPGAILILRKKPAYGQDFVSEALARKFGLTFVNATKEGEPTLDSGMLVSQNPDDDREARFVEQASSAVQIIVHVHCQWRYFDGDQQANIRKCLNRASACITPAEFTIFSLRKECANRQLKFFSATNGVDPQLFAPTDDSERTAWRRKKGIPDGLVLFAHVGRLENAKGLEVLEPFARLLAGKKIGLMLQFPGWGSKQLLEYSDDFSSRLKREFPGQVFVLKDKPLGEREGETKRPISYCDALISPSLSEVCPLVVLEALAAGVPVFATRSTEFYDETLAAQPNLRSALTLIDFPGAVDRNVSRKFLSYGNDAQALAEQMVEKICDFVEPTTEGRNAIRDSAIAAGFTEEKMLERIGRIYSEFENP